MATLRVTVSMPPPAASGTITRIGRLGKFWAWATAVSSAQDNASPLIKIFVFMMPPPTGFRCFRH
jgi:hypothetical protein